jgi:outer membrane protein assembly factor BamB
VDDVNTIYSRKQMSINGGEWKWRLKSNYPTLSGLTPAGGGVFFGDIGDHFYAVDATNGQRLWGQKLDAQSPAG